MKRIQAFAILGLMAFLLCVAFSNVALAETELNMQNSFALFNGAYLIVHVEPPSTGLQVKVTAVSGWVKSEDGSWSSNWHKSATATTDSNGNAEFRMLQLLKKQITVIITVNGKIERHTYWLKPFYNAPTYQETINGGPIQVVPETPLGPIAASASMIGAFAVFIGLRKRKVAIP